MILSIVKIGFPTGWIAFEACHIGRLSVSIVGNCQLVDYSSDLYQCILKMFSLAREDKISG